MKKRTVAIIGLVYCSLVIFILANVYIKVEYNMNLLQYAKKSQKITKEEKEWLKKHGDLIYGSDQNSPPLRFKDTKDLQYKGIVVDLITALSIEIGQDIYFKPNESWLDSINNLSNNKTDFFDLIPSKQRSEIFVFSDPLYTLKGNILKRKENSNINSYQDLNNINIAIPKGDYAIEFLQTKLGKDNLKIVLTDNLESSINLLSEGKVDAVIGDEPVLAFYLDNLNLNDKLDILNKPVYTEKAVLAVPKEEKELLSILNKGIFKLNKNKTLNNIKEKWYGKYIYNEFESKKDIVFIGVLIFTANILIILYILYWLNYFLKRKISAKNKELTENKNTLETMFDSITDIMIIINKDYEIIKGNSAFYEFINKDDKYSQEFNLKLFSDSIENGFKDNTEISNEYKLKDKILKVNTFSIKNKQDNLNTLVLVIKDITKEKLAEKQLFQDNKMFAVGQLASGVAHEIRNPLGIIRNYCYLLKEEDNSKEEERFYIKSIENNIDRAKNIIENLLNFVRISDNKLHLTNMKSFINDILQLESKILERNNINVVVNCIENLEVPIYKESLNHILLNLISNSIDALENGGFIEIGCSIEKTYLNLYVKDNGTGIDEDILENIFNPFFTTKDLGKGTGLGLYITYNELQKCNGTISVNSKKNEGTCFNIKIPLSKGGK